jgi:hypothetical protein
MKASMNQRRAYTSLEERRENTKEYKKEHYQANKETILEKMKDTYQANKEQICEYQKNIVK